MSEMTIITDALFATFGGDLVTLEGETHFKNSQQIHTLLEKHGSTSIQSRFHFPLFENDS